MVQTEARSCLEEGQNKKKNCSKLFSLPSVASDQLMLHPACRSCFLVKSMVSTTRNQKNLIPPPVNRGKEASFGP